MSLPEARGAGRAMLGVVKWFGGINKSTGRENNFGFVVAQTGTDVYLNKGDWRSAALPKENQIIYFTALQQSGKLKAEEAMPVSTVGVEAFLCCMYSQSGRPLLIKPAALKAKMLSLIVASLKDGSDELLEKTLQGEDRASGILSDLEKISGWRAIVERVSQLGLAPVYCGTVKVKEEAVEAARLKEETRQKRIREEKEKLRTAEEARKKKARDEVEKQKLKARLNFQRLLKLLDTNYLTSMDAILDLRDTGGLNKEEELRNWAVKRYPAKGYDRLSLEQVLAVLTCAPELLLKARAGSGKTTVIKSKVDFLIDHLGVKPDEILVLAFNKQAAKKVQRELVQEYGHIGFRTAFTFHSFAHRTYKPTQDLLYDGDTGLTKKQSEFVRELIAEEVNPVFRERLYTFFRKELVELDNAGDLLSKEQRYEFRRASAQETLKGDIVKSAGEKWIADFLFEHDIKYVYERGWYLDSTGEEGRYHPDFSLAVQARWPNVVIEHWGIEPSDPNSVTPEHWTTSAAEYRNQIFNKRDYWNNWNRENPDRQVLFLETSVADLRGGRQRFESHLKGLLNQHGILVEMLPKSERLERVISRRLPKFISLCGSFISRAKKINYSGGALKEPRPAIRSGDERTRFFFEFCCRLSKRYEQRKLDKNLIDFDDLLSLATEKINLSSEPFLRSFDRAEIPLRDLKWILVDEYQDFSAGFFGLVEAVKQKSGASIFCVGDDWQAINGFAGSNLKFFNGFNFYFPSSKELPLNNNYRSQPRIVQGGNRFMEHIGGGESLAQAKLPEHHLELLYANKIFIEARACKQDGHPDSVYRSFKEIKGQRMDIDVSLEVARLLKACHAIILNTMGHAKSFLILTRSNKLAFGYESPEDFKKKLKSCFSPADLTRLMDSNPQAKGDFDSKIKCMTAHKSKGLEADVTIVLNVTDRNFPMEHTDAVLFEPLGATVEEELMEEERLFYVALTRAKRRVFLVTERGRESRFLLRVDHREVTINKNLGLAGSAYNLSF